MLLSLTLLDCASILAASNDINVSVGSSTTPYRDAVEIGNPTGQYGQSSRPGPTASVQFTRWFSDSQGNAVFGEFNYQDTSTTLHGPTNPNVTTWTMHRISADVGFERRFLTNHRLNPYLKVGAGSMVFVSAQASNLEGSAGLDCRLEGLVGVGVEYKLSKHFSLTGEYEARFLRNSNFSDVTWNPRNNVISEPKVGISSHF